MNAVIIIRLYFENQNYNFCYFVMIKKIKINFYQINKNQ